MHATAPTDDNIFVAHDETARGATEGPWPIDCIVLSSCLSSRVASRLFGRLHANLIQVMSD